ncbi:MAG: AraC family ligand binding domain-containing protein [Chloroflexi bacterium]|nr:AraC family ligand binding domain-containing protein [Chloroflexota bacterium]
MRPQIQPFPDDRAGEVGVDAARARLRAAGVEPSAWRNGPGDRYAQHDHATTKLLICAEGSITFFVGPDADPVELTAGHGLVLPARTAHAAIVGANGCTCLEAHRPPG